MLKNFAWAPKEVCRALTMAREACLENPHRGYLAYALSYLDAIPGVAFRSGESGVKDQILYALSNLQAWRGPAAREAKRLLEKYATR